MSHVNLFQCLFFTFRPFIKYTCRDFLRKALRREITDPFEDKFSNMIESEPVSHTSIFLLQSREKYNCNTIFTLRD